MTVELFSVTFDAHDPQRLARFWAGVLGRDVVDDREDGGLVVLPDDDPGMRIRVLPGAQEKTGPNRIHLELTSKSLEDQQAIVDRALDLGGAHLDVGQLPEEDHVVLADPDGNELCVIGPGNSFLAGCGRLGDLSCDGTQAVGRFWSEALGWPLVWDQDEETAIQAPGGGPKIAWGGPPVRSPAARERIHLDLAVTAADRAAEVERLVGLGATLVREETGSVVLTDPDGSEFCVLVD